MSTSIFCQAENEFHRARNQELVNICKRNHQSDRSKLDVQQKRKFKLKEGKLKERRLRLNMKQSDRLWQK